VRTIVHISDLHFGRVDEKRVLPLSKLIKKIDPDIVVISGDLTQRAKAEQFIAAEAFIRSLKQNVLVIPGNHDIPLFNLFARIFAPFKKYSEFINADLSPFYKDSEIAILGINSVRRDRATSGKIKDIDFTRAEELFGKLDPKIVKIVVAHHPFDLIPSEVKTYKHVHTAMKGSKKTIKRMSKMGIDIFLSGHLHVFNAGASIRHKIEGYSGLMVQAGTAISTRTHGGQVSFNVLRINKKKIIVEHYAGEKETPNYVLVSKSKFINIGEVWKKAE
jgi:3',5'-cyclic AMP phosphodiesterase CpdA